MNEKIDETITKETLLKGVAVLDFTANLFVSQNLLEAKIVPVFGELSPDSWKEIVKLLKETPIVYGILSKPEVENNVWYIARGTLPVKGEDAKIIFKKPPGRKDLPDDISELVKDNKIICYEKGDIIAEKKLHTPGIPGINVFGEEIPPEPGKWIAFPVGSNVEIFTEDQYLRASADGKLDISDSNISILENYKINGSVDHVIGNIIFKGKLLEVGGIENGRTVNVKGDLAVSGGIENAIVNIEGNLTVNGVVSGEHCRVFVQNDMTCSVIEQAKVEVTGDLIVKNYILDADCICKGNIILKEKKAMILGGYVTFGKTLTANTIGSDQNTTTHIYGGFLNIHVEEYEALKNSYNANLKKLTDIKKGLEKIEEIEKIKPLDDKYQIIKKRFKSGLIDIINELKTSREKIAKLEAIIKLSPEPELIVNKTIHPGVLITINNAHYEVKNEIKYSKFQLVKGEITYTGLR
jgi:uncharacterized protein (DUF342 family)